MGRTFPVIVGAVKGYLDDDISDELQFNRPFKPGEINGAYTVRRCLVERLWEGQIIL